MPNKIHDLASAGECRQRSLFPEFCDGAVENAIRSFGNTVVSLLDALESVLNQLENVEDDLQNVKYASAPSGQCGGLLVQQWYSESDIKILPVLSLFHVSCRSGMGVKQRTDVCTFASLIFRKGPRGGGGGFQRSPYSLCTLECLRRSSETSRPSQR